MEGLLFGMSDGVTSSCFSPTLDEILPDWDDSLFTLGDGCVEKQVTCDKSPSHESDSGLSCVSMSDVKSPRSLSGEDILMDLGISDMSDNYQTMELREEKPLLDADPDPLSFLISSDEDENTSDKPGSCVEQSTTDSESLDCNMNVKSSRSIQKPLTFNAVQCEKIDNVGKPTNKVIITPVSTKSSAVKVVKLVTPIATGKTVTTDDVAKALVERNKKNAQNARLNRERKKTYIKGLEEEVDSLKTENHSLKEETTSLKTEKRVLEEEVAYLKSVLANDSSLSALLQNIPSVKNVKLSSSFQSSKRNAGADHDHESVPKKPRTGGVCLHVEGENVSLELCSRCSKMASKSDVDK